MISLCMCTYRPGGIDIFAQSFLGMEQGADYEVVIVDDCPGRVGRGTVPKYLEEKGVKLGWYGKSKSKSYPETRGGFCNAMNTAISHVRGDWTVWVSDYTFMPNNWLNQWKEVIFAYEYPRFLVSGSAILYSAPKPAHPGDIQTWDNVVDMQIKWPWVPWEFETFYVAIPMQFFLEINGVDERADHCHAWPVSSKIKQAKRLQYPIGTKPEICCFMVDHREWETKDESNQVGNGLWKIGGEWRSMETEPVWEVPSPNKFDLVAMRKENGIV